MEEESNKILNENPNEILCINFNQDGSCIAIGTETGFKIINTLPFLDICYQNMGGGIGIIEMLNTTNIFGLVGGGKNPKYPLNELIIWDQEKKTELSKIKTKKKILNVKLTENKIFVVNFDKIFVFDFNTLNLIDTLETKNQKGLISLCYKQDIVAYPDNIHEGTIIIKNYDTNKEEKLKAHKTPLSCIQLNQDGTMIGTSSLKGTLIRVYSISEKTLIREVRRGAESANVNCISFDISQKYLLVVSDRKTIHIFFLINNSENQSNSNRNSSNNNNNISEGDDMINNTININKNILELDNKKSKLSGMSNFFNVGKRYFGSEWSFAKFKQTSHKLISIFGPDNSILVVTFEGKYYQAVFDPVNGGECNKIQEEKF